MQPVRTRRSCHSEPSTARQAAGTWRTPESLRAGALQVLSAAVLWGVSGTAAQILMQRDGFSPSWLVTVRLIVAGLSVLLLTRAGPQAARPHLLGPFARRGDGLRLAVFSVVGILAFQMTCFQAISAASAPAATFLQELGPVILAVSGSVLSRRLPGPVRLAAMAVACVGTGLLSTAGHLDRLAVSPSGLAWGLGSAFALAFYSAYPRRLLSRYDSRVVMGHGMFLAGAVSALFAHPWDLGEARLTLGSISLLAVVVFLGTAAAFTLYAASLTRLRPVESAFLSSAEPLTSAFAASLWLGVRLTTPMVLGGIMILTAVVLLARPAARPSRSGDPPPGGQRAMAERMTGILSEVKP